MNSCLVMRNRIIKTFETCYGFKPDSFIIHSYKDLGDRVLVNYETKINGTLYRKNGYIVMDNKS